MMVYIDSFNAPYRGMIMCHMIADSTEELLLMCDKIEVQRKWIQDKGTWYEHFDICTTKKKLAIAAGAKEITARELVIIETEHRKTAPGKIKRKTAPAPAPGNSNGKTI